MTTYHVWLTGQDEPEIVQAHFMGEADGLLHFSDILDDHPTNGRFPVRLVREFLPGEWHRWAAVHDEAEHA